MTTRMVSAKLDQEEYIKLKATGLPVRFLLLRGMEVSNIRFDIVERFVSLEKKIEFLSEQLRDLKEEKV